MSNRFHSKWHRASHHTYKNPAILDAGWDPIASNDVPFSGDFVMSPRTACLSRISGDTVVTEDIYGMEYITGGEDPGRKITIHPEIDLAGSAVSSNDLHVRGVEYIYNSVSGEETALTITGSIDINPVAGEDPEDPEVTGTAGGIYIHDGFFTMTGNSTQSGDSVQYGDATQTGDYTQTGDHTQTGDYALTGDFTQEGNYVITGSITADGSGAYMYISGADPDGYGLKVVNDFWVGGGSVFDGDVTINGNLNVKESTTLESTLDVNGQTTLGDKTVIQKNGIEVSGNSIFKNNVNIIGDVTTDHNLYVIGSGPSAGSAYFKAISATEATIVSALIKEVDISASESNGYIIKTPNPQGKIIPNPLPGTGDAGKNNFYLSGDTLYSDSWGYFEGELKTASALYADGPVTFANTLNVNGNTDIGGTLGVTGVVDFDSTLNVDGATTLNGGVTVKTSPGNKSMTFDGEKIFRKDGTQTAVEFLFPSYGGTLVARPNSPLPPSGNIPMFDEYGNIVDSGNNATDFYPMVEKTWEQLKAMRDGGTLVPGQRYRITDYVATTVQVDTQSANHPFDIIVRADSTNKLNENAYAIKNAEDTTYFVNSKLEAWQVWYCLDNDTNRFAWADSANGKGVVYRLIDEFNNDCPYDFKGITMKAYGDTDNVFRYTFDSGAAGDNTDYSLSGGTLNVCNNIIGRYFTFNKLRINQIIFKGRDCYSNTFKYNCRSNTFGSYCNSNTFDDLCYSNTFGDSCQYNTFGDNCNSNTFGDNCNSNTFDIGCSSNTFGSSCSYNTLGSSCLSNIFDDNCSMNTFGCFCSSNTFGFNCRTNRLGESCDTNRLDKSCGSNTFGDNCSYNTLGGSCSHNTLGNGCVKIVFGYKPSDFSSTVSYEVGDVCRRFYQTYRCTVAHTGSWNESHFVMDPLSAARAFYQFVTFENGVSYVFLDCTATRTGTELYSNVTVSKGILGTDAQPKVIQDANKSQSFKTTYTPANSQVISV